MRQKVSVPAIVGGIVVAVLIVGFFAYRALSGNAGGVNETSPYANLSPAEKLKHFQEVEASKHKKSAMTINSDGSVTKAEGSPTPDTATK